MHSLIRPWVCSSCAKHIRHFPGHSPRRLKRFDGLCKQSYSTRPLVKDGRPFRLAVIGSGPAGFYTAYRVMSKIEDANVDMYEQLPVPYGLVRFGVAPDHPEVKNCQDKFHEVAESPNFNFIGNISIGNDAGSLPLSAIIPHYDAVLFAYGASQDRKLGIPGEDTLKGIFSARAFVGWYNGLPEYANLGPDLSTAEEAVIVGQGNVALDIARTLLADLKELRKTDITEAAVEALSHSRIQRVRVVGRRGPAQAAFTIKEIRELMNLKDVGFEPIDHDLMPSDVLKLPRAPKRIMQLLQKGSALTSDEAAKRWSLNFRLSPTRFNGAPSNPDRLASLTFDKTRLIPNTSDPSARAENTGTRIDVSADLAFRSIGYKSEGLPGMSDLGIPFDNRLGIITNDGQGRILNPALGPAGDLTSMHVPGMYCAGWVKRGPTGVIASTMADAFATADIIAEDWRSHALFINPGQHDQVRDGWHAVQAEVEGRGCRRVSWEDWKKINSAELDRGKQRNKQREKFTNIKDMLAVLD